MSDPRITAALDSFADYGISEREEVLVAVLRDVARLHHEMRPEYRECDECGKDWRCPTARALAPLAELGGDP